MSQASLGLSDSKKNGCRNMKIMIFSPSISGEGGIFSVSANLIISGCRGYYGWGYH